LPRTADGIRVFVMGESTHSDEPDHGKEMVRTIAGKAGLGVGADVRMYEEPDDEGGGPEPANPSLEQIFGNSIEALIGNPSYVESLVKKARSHAPKDGMPTFVCISLGDNINEEAGSAVDAVMAAKHGSKVYQAAAKILGHAPSGADGDTLLHIFETQLRKKLELPENKSRLLENQAALTGTLEAGLDEDVLVFFAVGNSHDTDAPGAAPTSRDTANVKGEIPVGASDAATGKPTFWSSVGATIIMPGANVPVGPKRANGLAELVDGTSFSEPNAAGLAALMAKAGLTNVRDIAKALTCPEMGQLAKGVNGAIVPNELAEVIAARTHQAICDHPLPV
jgi:hypothetical protein